MKVNLAYFHFIIDIYQDYVIPSNTAILPLILPQLFSIGGMRKVSYEDIRSHKKHYCPALLSGRSWVPSGNDAAIRMI